MIKGTIANKKRSIMLVRGRLLVEQASQRLTREDVDHGVYMSGHWRYRPNRLGQLASIDTMRARALFPPADFIVVDECDQSNSKSFLNFLNAYPSAYILGVTATPYSKTGLSHLADFVVRPITFDALVELGYLVKPKYFAPENYDFSKIKISKGDYSTPELNEFMNRSVLIGDLVENWKLLSEGRSTLVFAVTVEHSKHIAAQFASQGIPSAHCDADTPEAIRTRCIEKLQSGEIKILSNVGLFCRGVDLPFLSCIMFARPTKSINLYIQQCGRGTRPFPNKKDFFILDHAGNVMRFGFIEDERPAVLEPLKNKKETVPRIFTCEHCYAVVASLPCKECGKAPSVESVKKRLLEIEPGVLKELTKQKMFAEIRPIQIQMEIGRLKEIQLSKGYKPGWIYHQLKNKFGEQIANEHYRKKL
jgi:DNA repair protein RadD